MLVEKDFLIVLKHQNKTIAKQGNRAGGSLYQGDEAYNRTYYCVAGACNFLLTSQSLRSVSWVCREESPNFSNLSYSVPGSAAENCF